MRTILNQIHNYIIQNQQIDDDSRMDLLSMFNNNNNTPIQLDYPSKCYLRYLVNSQPDELYQTIVDYIINCSFKSAKYLIWLINQKLQFNH